MVARQSTEVIPNLPKKEVDMEQSKNNPENIAETAIDYPMKDREAESDDSKTIRVDRE